MTVILRDIIEAIGSSCRESLPNGTQFSLKGNLGCIIVTCSFKSTAFKQYLMVEATFYTSLSSLVAATSSTNNEIDS